MGKYTLRITGKPIEDALKMLEAAESIKTGGRTLSWDEDPSSPQVALSVTVDAPTLIEAEKLVEAALPEHGSYTVGRPEPVEDDRDA